MILDRHSDARDAEFDPWDDGRPDARELAEMAAWAAAEERAENDHHASLTYR